MLRCGQETAALDPLRGTAAAAVPLPCRWSTTRRSLMKLAVSAAVLVVVLASVWLGSWQWDRYEAKAERPVSLR